MFEIFYNNNNKTKKEVEEERGEEKEKETAEEVCLDAMAGAAAAMLQPWKEPVGR